MSNIIHNHWNGKSENNYNTIIINHKNTNLIYNYGYLINDKWNKSISKIGYDNDEFPICLNSLAIMNYEIHIKHRNFVIIDPIIICNSSNRFSLYRFECNHSHDFDHDHNDMFIFYKLITNKYTLKTKNIREILNAILMTSAKL
jgi:hypothetical protein